MSCRDIATNVITLDPRVTPQMRKLVLLEMCSILNNAAIHLFGSGYKSAAMECHATRHSIEHLYSEKDLQ
jgi:hypothetical protein